MIELDVTISLPLAFLAGMVSFLSPCILPVVPSYITFVSGVTLDELREGDRRGARRKAAVHAAIFGLGFGLVFMTLGAATTAAGRAFTQVLPWITRAGGVVVILFGLWLLGVFRETRWGRALSRERRVRLEEKPAGLLGSLAVGVAFGAGWSPCIGPVLASILLYASLDHTVLQGTLLLATYGAGLAVPFIGSAVAFNWFLAGLDRIGRWLPWVERGAGLILVVMGLLMLTGYFIEMSAVLADMGQLIYIEAPEESTVP